MNIDKPPRIRIGPTPGVKYDEVGLTEREHQVYTLMCSGDSYVEIAKELGFQSYYSVKNYAHKIFQKLQVKNRYELLARFGQNNPTFTPVKIVIKEVPIVKVSEVTVSDEVIINEDQEAILNAILTVYYDLILRIAGPTIRGALIREKQKRTLLISKGDSDSVQC